MSKYANTPKTGSKSPRSYDPKNSSSSGGKRPAVVGMYKPVGKNTPTAPGKKKSY